MQSITLDELPITIEGGGVELRTHDVGGMTVGVMRLQKGADLRPLVKGLPGDLCQCPHWGYMLRGRVSMHTASGAETYEAGQAFYRAPGHAPEALEDSEYVDFAPREDFAAVLEHVKAQAV
jgi:hypothetical protein